MGWSLFEMLEIKWWLKDAQSLLPYEAYGVCNLMGVVSSSLMNRAN